MKRLKKNVRGVWQQRRQQEQRDLPSCQVGLVGCLVVIMLLMRLKILAMRVIITQTQFLLALFSEVICLPGARVLPMLVSLTQFYLCKLYPGGVKAEGPQEQTSRAENSTKDSRFTGFFKSSPTSSPSVPKRKTFGGFGISSLGVRQESANHEVIDERNDRTE